MPSIKKHKTNFAWEYKPEAKSWVQNKDDERRYNSRQWRNLAKDIRANEPFCRMCKEKGITKIATVTDHIQAVRLGGFFWDRNNLQPLCESCHNAKKV
jgi:5-methylcytosine-specific restriction protein A